MFITKEIKKIKLHSYLTKYLWTFLITWLFLKQDQVTFDTLKFPPNHCYICKIQHSKMLLLWRWRQHVPPKCRCEPTSHTLAKPIKLSFDNTLCEILKTYASKQILYTCLNFQQTRCHTCSTAVIPLKVYFWFSLEKFKVAQTLNKFRTRRFFPMLTKVCSFSTPWVNSIRHCP